LMKVKKKVPTLPAGNEAWSHQMYTDMHGFR